MLLMYIPQFPGSFDVLAEEFGLFGRWIGLKSVVVNHTSIAHAVPRASNINVAALVGQYLPERRFGQLETPHDTSLHTQFHLLMQP